MPRRLPLKDPDEFGDVATWDEFVGHMKSDTRRPGQRYSSDGSYIRPKGKDKRLSKRKQRSRERYNGK